MAGFDPITYGRGFNLITEAVMPRRPDLLAKIQLLLTKSRWVRRLRKQWELKRAYAQGSKILNAFGACVMTNSGMAGGSADRQVPNPFLLFHSVG